MKHISRLNLCMAAIFVSVACLVAASSAQASTIKTISYTDTIASTTTNWSNTLEFGKFNTTWGTLQSVTVKLDGALSSVFTITNNASVASDTSKGTASTDVTIIALSSAVADVQTTLAIASSVYTYSNLAGGSTIYSNELGGSGTASSEYTTANILELFSGTGNIVLNATAETATHFDYTGGNTTGKQVTYAGVTGTVTYTYAVPEPSTLALLGVLGVSLLGYGWRRQRAKG